MRSMQCIWRGAAFGMIAAAGVSLGSGDVSALQSHEVLADKTLEQRARDISLGLRCLVCQNQSIDDSDAQVAQDLRRLVRQRLVAGDSDNNVRAYIVARYGDFILLKPPLNVRTLLLWVSPALVLLLGASLIIRARRSARQEAPELCEAERTELRNVLEYKAPDS